MQYLNTVKAAEALQQRGIPATAKTLQKYRAVGGGPAFRKFGVRVLYAESDLQLWIESKLSEPMHSTSTETGAA